MSADREGEAVYLGTQVEVATWIFGLVLTEEISPWSFAQIPLVRAQVELSPVDARLDQSGAEVVLQAGRRGLVAHRA